MGIAGISPWSILLILAIVILLFGTKRIKDAGGDIGGFFSGLKRGLREIKKEEDE